MTSNVRTRLVLDIDLDTEPISGVVVDDDHDGEAFSGWIALTRTIEAALYAGRQARSRPPTQDL